MGAPTGRWRCCGSIQAADSHVRVIRFTRNFGQTAAFAAGFAYARGGLIVTFDGDLQNDPADIPRLVDMARTHDVVCGWRKDRKDDFLTRHVPSVVANRLLSAVSGVHASRHRLFTQGLPRRGGQAVEADTWHAPLSAGTGQSARRRPGDRGGRQSPAATVRAIEVRPLADVQGLRGSLCAPASPDAGGRRSGDGSGAPAPPHAEAVGPGRCLASTRSPRSAKAASRS